MEPPKTWELRRRRYPWHPECDLWLVVGPCSRADAVATANQLLGAERQWVIRHGWSLT